MTLVSHFVLEKTKLGVIYLLLFILSAILLSASRIFVVYLAFYESEFYLKSE